MKTKLALISIVLLSGCAGIRFNPGPADDAFTYFEPTPFLQVKVAVDCVITADVVTLPGRKRSLTLKSGLGSAKLNVTTANGIITSLGQETDTKVPDTINALSGLVRTTADAHLFADKPDGEKKVCPARVSLYAITAEAGGNVSVATAPISLPVTAAPVAVESREHADAQARAIMDRWLRDHPVPAPPPAGK